MKVTFNRILRYLAIACIICFLLLINPHNLSLETNLSVYIGLASSTLLLVNSLVSEKINKKKK